MVYCVLFVMMSANIEKNSADSKERHVLTAYGIFLVVSLASMQIKSFWNPFSKIKLLVWNSSDWFESFSPLNNDVTEGVITTRSNRMKLRLQNSARKLKIYIDPTAWPAGSAVRIKKKRSKGKMDQTEKKTVQRNRNSVAGSRNRFDLHVQATPWPLYHSDTHDLKN